MIPTEHEGTSTFLQYFFHADRQFPASRKDFGMKTQLGGFWVTGFWGGHRDVIFTADLQTHFP
jgi:hypothetical protein